MDQKVFRTGNSLAVTIPSRFVESVGVKAGDKVNVRQEIGRGRIVYQFSGSRQLVFDEQFSKDEKNLNNEQSCHRTERACAGMRNLVSDRAIKL